jgi:hypothetical protein
VLDCLDQQPVSRALPCEATLRRCLQTTDSAALDAAVAGWAVGQLAAQQALAAGANVDLVSADPGQFLFLRLEGANDTLSIPDLRSRLAARWSIPPVALSRVACARH